MNGLWRTPAPGRFAGCWDQVKIVIAQGQSQYGIISPKGVETPMEEMTMTQDRSLEAFKRLVPHLRGSLWWGSDGLIKEKLPQFVRREDRKGHPLLSLLREEVRTRMDAVPMLSGTSGDSMSPHRKRCCIDVIGMEKCDLAHHTFFGSIIEPAMMTVAELQDGVSPKKGEFRFEAKQDAGPSGEQVRMRKKANFACRQMHPNWDKPVVSDDEMKMVDDFCLIHKL